MSSSISWNKSDPSYLMFALWLRMVKYLNSVFEFIFFFFILVYSNMTDTATHLSGSNLRLEFQENFNFLIFFYIFV